MVWPSGYSFGKIATTGFYSVTLGSQPRPEKGKMARHQISCLGVHGSLVLLLTLHAACMRQSVIPRPPGGGFALYLSPERRSPEDLVVLSTFLAEVEQLLPRQVKAAI